MEQVLLPREVVEAINSIREKSGEKTLFNYPTIIRHQNTKEDYRAIATYINKSDLNFKKYFSGLINGFQIEWSKEEKVRMYYQGFVENGRTHIAESIKKILGMLEIEIEGVNK
jgi:hypothetical protein